MNKDKQLKLIVGIKLLLSKDQIDKAIENLFVLVRSFDEKPADDQIISPILYADFSSHEKSLVIQSATLARIEEAYRNSTITWESMSITKSKIVSAVYDILELIKETLITIKEEDPLFPTKLEDINRGSTVKSPDSLEEFENIEELASKKYRYNVNVDTSKVTKLLEEKLNYLSKQLEGK